MKNLLKSFIVWLMLVAIPFQGFAAASMLTCAPVQVAVQTAMPAGHCDTMQAAPQHHAGAKQADTSSAHHHSAGKCNTCASCCFGAAMAPSTPVARVPGETCVLADFARPRVNVPKVDLDLPERPPKASLT